MILCGQDETIAPQPCVAHMVITAKQKPQPLILDVCPTENICQEKYRDHIESRNREKRRKKGTLELSKIKKK
jgi:hypothetical protein